MSKFIQRLDVDADVLRLVGHKHSEVYQEFDGEVFANGFRPRFIVSSIDPEYKGLVMAELQLIDENGFPFFYSEPRSQLPEQWDLQPEDLDDTFVITINQL